MPGLEVIGNLLLKRSVASLIKIGIDKFDIKKTKEGKLNLLIETLEDDIEFEKKIENESLLTSYSKTNLENYYKLSEAYERKRFFEDTLIGFSKENKKKAVKEIEKRIDVLIEEKEKGIIYNFLANFYVETNILKSEHYNLLALENKKELIKSKKAEIYARQAFSELIHSELDKGLINISNAISLEPFNSNYKIIEIKILLELKHLDGVFTKIHILIDEFSENNDIVRLSDILMLLAFYWQQKNNENKALKTFKQSYKLIEKS